MRSVYGLFIGFVLIAFSLGGCRVDTASFLAPNEIPTSTSVAPLPTRTLPPPITPETTRKVIAICTWDEPDTLFVYGMDPVVVLEERIPEDLIFSLLYHGQIFIDTYQETQIIENMEVTITQTLVTEGDPIYQWPFAHEGSPITLPQVNIEFKLKPNLRWSDGRFVTADDSVYGYDFAYGEPFQFFQAQLGVVTEKLPTAVSYSSLDDHTILWVGLPGYIPKSDQYIQEFAIPMPRHAWEPLYEKKRMSFMMLDEVAKFPLAIGEFQISEWSPGMVSLSRNPYFPDELSELSNISEIILIFSENQNSAQQLFASRKCDVVGDRLEMNIEWLKTNFNAPQ